MNRNRKILVLDDDHHVARLVSSVAKEHHSVNEIHHATSVEEAMQMLKNEEYCAILSDIHLTPENDGVGVEFIRAVDSTYGEKYFKKIIVMSHDVDRIIEALKSGAYVSIVKPFGTVELKQKLGMVLA